MSPKRRRTSRTPTPPSKRSIVSANVCNAHKSAVATWSRSVCKALRARTPLFRITDHRHQNQLDLLSCKPSFETFVSCLKMGSEEGPVINITTSRPLSLEQRQRTQQLPNRNRQIIKKSLPGRVGNEQRSSTTVQNEDQRMNAEQRQLRHGYDTGNEAALSAEGWNKNYGTAVTNPMTPFQKRTADLLIQTSTSAPTQPKVLIETSSRMERGKRKLASEEPAASISGTAESKIIPPVKKKKVKPQLSVPTTASQISGNWQGLKKSLGLKDRPKRPVPVKVMETTEIDAGKDTVAGAAPEIPYATADTFVKTKSFSGLTKTVALDCEFVGVGPGGRENMLARVSFVNQFGHCIYDKFVKPTELVKDYRTHVSGVRPQDLKKGEDFKIVQKEVTEILQGRTLVGHAVHHDLEVLLLSHPKSDIRDTSKYKPFRQITKGGTPSLKKLTAKILGFGVQSGEHDSVQDAQATMRLYTMYKREWESKVSLRGKKLRMLQKKKKSDSKEITASQ